MRFLLVLFLAAGLSSGCATTSGPSADIRTEVAPDAVFSAYKTYSWLTQPEGATPEGSQFIVGAIDAQLQQRGWRKTADGDIAVRVQVATANKQTLESVYSPGGGGRGPMAGMGTMTTRAVAYREGTLVVDLFDLSAKRAVWRGTATGVLPPSQDQVKGVVDSVIKDMFARIPTAP
ncbi:DUF4136 domain-containing protein [Luteimonas sp. SX5]|uniref:DUF4136 domain-containing protein n=1 Tax=Luteimonas galliterrae TaxID=2940486 RepID=A0ABT0MIN0_9GAMM|nr:DUF4136 domain-containing protein [Luteimonas galliterrae]MCL1634737.1 DUF4136 domain-containing protein [Luteimonas galliterrae]